VLGLLFRNPERIAATRKYIEDFSLDNYDQDKVAYDAQKADNDLDYLEYLVRQATYLAVDWTKDMLQSPRLRPHLNNMLWNVRDVSGNGLTLFTSDRPVVMTNGVGYDWSNIAVPISPTKAFVATNNREVMNTLITMPAMQFIIESNRRVLRYAQKYAWAVNNEQVNVANRHLSQESEVSRTFFDGPPYRNYVDSALNHPASASSYGPYAMAGKSH
jgi:hypothetical protein